MHAINTIGKLISRAHENMSDHDKRRFVVAFEELDDNVNKIAADPTFIPHHTTEVYDTVIQGQPVGSDLLVQGQPVGKSLFWVSEQVLDWASELLGGLDNYYMCRNTSCRAFMPHTCWVKEEGHDRFRCPFCLRDYQPWATKPTHMTPNKLLIASCNGDENVDLELDMDPSAVRIWFVLSADTPS
ncbi:MAG: hypothetical protein ACKPKO_06750, partial [Candidatus Fonsibacter sp.]